MTWAADLLHAADALFPRAPGEHALLSLNAAGELCLAIPLPSGWQAWALSEADQAQPGADVAQAAFADLALGPTPWDAAKAAAQWAPWDALPAATRGIGLAGTMPADGPSR